MEAYKKYLTISRYHKEEDLIIDTQEEEQLMIDNLQKQNIHLFKELKELDKKHAKELKMAQESIALLRIEINKKEDLIRDLKSKICFLHIKLHSRSTNSREKNMSLSIRKFITDTRFPTGRGKNCFRCHKKLTKQEKKEYCIQHKYFTFQCIR